jgi:ERCC4-type nuclease
MKAAARIISNQRACIRTETAPSDPSPILLFDTREPDPHPWLPYLSLEWTRGTLATGDISLAGCGEFIAIERKSVSDLISCLCQGRERFTKELQRAARLPEFYIVIEDSYQSLLRGDYRSAMSPRAAWESVIAMQSRYRISFLFAGSVEIAAQLSQSILVRWYKEHTKAVEAALGPGETLTLRGKRSTGRATQQ